MRYKVDVEIVTGFISSGKTSFINYLIDETWINGERLLIIQCENGNSDIKYNIISNNITKKFLSPEEGLKTSKIKNLIALYSPHRIIIEQNGTENIEKTLEIFGSKELANLCSITTVYHMIDPVTFDMFYSNMASILMPALSSSNMVVINNIKSTSREIVDKIKNKVEMVNANGFILEVSSIDRLKEEIPGKKLLDKGILKKIRFFLRNI